MVKMEIRPDLEIEEPDEDKEFRLTMLDRGEEWSRTRDESMYLTKEQAKKLADFIYEQLK